MKRFVCFFTLMFFCLTGCATNPETGEKEFAPIKAIQSAAKYVDDIPDDAKASLLEALAWIFSAAGVGGGAVVLAQKGASYYRNKGAKESDRKEV